jgi:hypothetical protein
MSALFSPQEKGCCLSPKNDLKVNTHINVSLVDMGDRFDKLFRI